MDEFGSVFDRMNMKLGSKFLNSLRTKTQLLYRLQRVIVVDGATHSQNDGLEGNKGSLKDGAEACSSCTPAPSWFCDLVLTLLDLNY